MPEVSLIQSTDKPEELVTTAARNDYRADGVVNHTYDEVMSAVVPDAVHIETVVDEFQDGVWDFDKWTDGAEARTVFEESGTTHFPDDVLREARKRSLIDELFRAGHWGPFEHPSATIALEGVTRVTMAQLTRHRPFTFDIMSLRYVSVDMEMDDVLGERFQFPEALADGEVVTREGVEELDDPEGIQKIYADAYRDAIESYEELLGEGMPPEEARKVLPMGTKVNIVMSGNARAWMHLLNVRGKANVQREARETVDGIMRECKEWMPYAFEAYDEKLPMALNP